jgi:hypothetical protein
MSQVTMKHGAHTSGPWTIDWGVTRLDIFREGGQRVAVVHRTTCDGPPTWDDALAISNARLIASSPELLSALQLLYAEYEWDSGNPGRQETFAAVRAAIEKATGLAPVGVAE